MDSPRAKFEYELLQHHRELDVVVATVGGSSRREVLFALPLLAGDDHYTRQEEDQVAGGLEGGSYLPRALQHPLVEHGSSRTIISLRLVSADGVKKSEQSGGDVYSWDVSLSWPRDLRLSSQVTQMARAASDGASSVDIIGSCKQVRARPALRVVFRAAFGLISYDLQAFLSQWTKRRDFVGELRTKVIGTISSSASSR